MTPESALPHLIFRLATTEDASILAPLVNSAYRGDASRAGWTTEADLVEGERIDAEALRRLISKPRSLILLCVQEGEIVGSVHLEQTDLDSAYLGLFVVKPTLQGGGIGKRFLQEAERVARKTFGVSRIWMTVITLREELLAYYERRGYRRTGKLKPFPVESGASVPQVENLQLEILEKNLDEAWTPNDVESS